MTAATVLRVMGAYGRLYQDGHGIAEDWLLGKDFKIISGPYFSIRDLQVLWDKGYREIHVIHQNSRSPTGWATRVIHIEPWTGEQ